MQVNNVPQDDISTYAANKKAIYAQDDDGRVKVVGSSGWNAEEVVTKQALHELESMAKEAYCEVKKGLKSPLYYYMYSSRMDLQLLSDATGFFKWSIKREFKPHIFKKIKQKRLEIYADALGIDANILKTIKEDKHECR